VLSRLYNLYISSDKVFARRIAKTTGLIPGNLKLFKLAFTNKGSQTSTNKTPTQNNERLEYLGDAVLDLVVGEFLYSKYPSENEGFLTKMRAKIVNRKILNDLGERMELDVFLNMFGTPHGKSTLGNALEAFVGAVYCDSGYEKCRRFVIHRILQPYVDLSSLEALDENYKSQLLELSQKEGWTLGYEMLEKYKVENRDRFKVAVVINDEQVSIADDYNKKNAEQEASKTALEKLGYYNN